MAKDIEKIIDTTVMPEMEYVKPKHRTKTIEEDVPEIVLPKTKAEMYEEAKDRLEQKTSAVSKGYYRGKRNRPKPVSVQKPASAQKQVEKKVKTVDLESAAAKAAGAASIAEHENIKKLKARIDVMRKTVLEPKWVGGAEELIPFAWRNPLKTDIARPTKFYRVAVHVGKDRSQFLPTPSGE